MPKSIFKDESFSLPVRLTIIVAVVVAALAVVNGITKDKIEENAGISINKAMSVIFENSTFIQIDTSELDIAENVTGVYGVNAENSAGYDGYCVLVTTKGFGGDVDIVVGVSSSLSVAGVRVVSHGETVGVNKTVADGSPLLTSLTDVTSSNISDVSVISGASYSSRAVIEGVKIALETAELFDNNEGGL